MAGIGGLFGDSIEPELQQHQPQHHHHFTGFHDLSSSPSSAMPGFGFGSGAPARPPAAAAAAADDMFLSDEAFARRLQAEEGGISLDDPADDYLSRLFGRGRAVHVDPRLTLI